MEDQVILERKTSFFSGPIFKYGIAGGIIASIFTYATYAVDEKLFMNKILVYIPMLLIVIVSILAALEKKKQFQGFIRYGEAVGIIIGTIMLALVVNTALNLLLFLVIDPGLMGRIMGMMKDMMAKQVEAGELTQKQLDAYDAMVAKTGVTRLMLFQIIGGIIIYGLIGLIIAFIAALFIRKEPPVQDVQNLNAHI
jgi:hypothetical protein